MNAKTDTDPIETRRAMAEVMGRHPLMDEVIVAVASLERGEDSGLRVAVDPYGERRRTGQDDAVVRDVAALRAALEGIPAAERAAILGRTPLALRAGRPCSAEVIRAQVAGWTWTGMGAHRFVAHDDALQVDVHLGAGFGKRRLTIKLMPQDTYAIELLRVLHRGFDLVVVEQVHDVYADDLDRQVRALYDRHAM